MMKLIRKKTVAFRETIRNMWQSENPEKTLSEESLDVMCERYLELQDILTNTNLGMTLNELVEYILQNSKNIKIGTPVNYIIERVDKNEYMLQIMEEK